MNSCQEGPGTHSQLGNYRRCVSIVSLTSFSLSQPSYTTPLDSVNFREKKLLLVSETGDERAFYLDFVYLALLVMIRRSAFVLCPIVCAWVVGRAEPEIDVSSPRMFAEAYSCPTLLLSLPLRPLPVTFIVYDTIDVQNVKRFSYLD